MRLILSITLAACAQTTSGLTAQMPLQAPALQQPGRPVRGVGTMGPHLMGPLADALAQPTARGDGAATTAASTSPHRVVLLEYDPETSRGLFWACDATGDDRLDLFEARRALEEIGDPAAPGWFRRLDNDRDGYLEWPEFDRFYNDIVRDGNPLPLRLVRPQPARVAAPPGEGAAAPTQGERVLDLFDANQDGGLDAAESMKLLEGLGLPAQFAPMIMGLDGNRDGKLSARELAPALAQFKVPLFSGATNAAAVQMHGVWAKMDADGNGAIETLELAAALRRIDPELERWAPHVLTRADQDGSQSLTAPELPPADPDGRAATPRPRAGAAANPPALPMAGDRGQR